MASHISQPSISPARAFSRCLLIPQVRDSASPFKTSLLESGTRVDRALKAAIAEMYLQGVSTRRVTKIVENHEKGNSV